MLEKKQGRIHIILLLKTVERDKHNTGNIQANPLLERLLQIICPKGGPFKDGISSLKNGGLYRTRM